MAEPKVSATTNNEYNHSGMVRDELCRRLSNKQYSRKRRPLAMKRSLWQENCEPGEIFFGLNRETDERSLAAFLQMISSPDMLNTLIPRLSDDEILEVVDFLTGLMKKHLQENEYHTHFLQEVKS